MRHRQVAVGVSPLTIVRSGPSNAHGGAAPCEVLVVGGEGRRRPLPSSAPARPAYTTEQRPARYWWWLAKADAAHCPHPLWPVQRPRRSTRTRTHAARIAVCEAIAAGPRCGS